jgi:2-methylisocitrate lyase-like PEP mutase family enzyme
MSCTVEEAVDRIAAARVAAPSGTFVLNARTDTYVAGAERRLRNSWLPRRRVTSANLRRRLGS